MTRSDTVMRVEFFGLARKYAGVSQFDLQMNENRTTLGDLIEQLQSGMPQLVDRCFVDREIAAGFIVNLDGKRFVRDNRTDLADSQNVFLMSIDAGG
jgi:molybdopterin converting factor small subunit